MTATYAYPTRPASTSTPQHLSKLEWYNRIFDDVRVSGATIAEVFRRTVGRCRPDANAFCSVVWRTQENLTADAGVSYRTFARWRDRFVDMGYLLQVDSGCGPQRYFVLKFPEWSVSDALEYAAYSLREISKLQSREFASHIRKNVLPAVLKEWKRQIALESFEEDSEELGRELAAIDSGCAPDQVTFGECGVVCEDPPEALQKLWDETPLPEEQSAKRSNCNLPKGQTAFLIYREPTESPLDSGSSSELTCAREARGETPPTDQNRSGSGSVSGEPETPEEDTTVELDAYRRLRRVFIAMFAQFERRLDPGCASRLARRYLERGAWPEALAETLDEKLTRLFGDGFSTGQVIRFLTADVDEWTPPPGLHIEPEASGAPPERICAETSEPSSWTPPPTEEALACARTGATPLGRRRAEQVWAEGLEALKSMVSAHLVSRWLEPFVALECVDGRLYGMAADDFCASWMRDKHAGLMADACGLNVVVLSPEQVVERYETKA